MTGTTAYLIRHAQSRPSSSIEDPAWPLSRLGFEQAETLGSLLESLDITRVYSSPYVRCLSTIEPFVKRSGLDLIVDEDLRERKLVEAIRKDFGEVWRRSWEDFAFALPGCESSLDAQSRFVDAVRRIVRVESGTIGICAHGNVMGLLLNHLESGYGREEADRMRNPDVVKLVAQDDALIWDRDFRLPGLDDIATDHRDTPIDW